MRIRQTTTWWFGANHAIPNGKEEPDLRKPGPSLPSPMVRDHPYPEPRAPEGDPKSAAPVCSARVAGPLVARMLHEPSVKKASDLHICRSEAFLAVRVTRFEPGPLDAQSSASPSSTNHGGGQYLARHCPSAHGLHAMAFEDVTHRRRSEVVEDVVCRPPVGRRRDYSTREDRDDLGSRR